VVVASDLISYYDVSGCYILRPSAFAMWEVSAQLGRTQPGPQPGWLCAGRCAAPPVCAVVSSCCVHGRSARIRGPDSHLPASWRCGDAWT